MHLRHGRDMIFISYNAADAACAQALCAELLARQVTYWCANGMASGESFPRQMNDALAAATQFAVLWSQTASNSEHVWNEVDAFYARYPQPRRMVFICLDTTSVPVLYASRLYIPAGGTATAWALALERLVEGKPPECAEQGSSSWGTAEQSFISLVPPGPAVRSKHVSRELIDEYAVHVADRFAVTSLLDEVARLREASDPRVPPNQLLTRGELLRIGEVPARDFWIDAFAVAARKGTRTLAALLLAQPDDSFSDAARRDRSMLLRRLRARDATLFG